MGFVRTEPVNTCRNFKKPRTTPPYNKNNTGEKVRELLRSVRRFVLTINLSQEWLFVKGEK